MTRWRRIIGLLALVAGTTLLLLMITKAGPSRLASEALKAGPALWLIVPISFSWFALNTAGWRLAFEAQDVGRSPGFLPLIRAYVAAEAVNNITPLMAVGGEPLKVVMLAPHADAERTVASVIGDNVVHALTAPPFMLVGLALGWVAFDLEQRLVLEWIAVTAGIALVALLAWMATARGLAGPLVRLAIRRTGAETGGVWQARADRVDALTDRFLSAGGWRLWASMGLHVAGRIMGAVEVWIIMAALDIPCSLAGAVFVIAVAHVGVNMAFGVVPNQLGVQEAAAYVVFAAVGLDPASGVTVMLVRRLRGFAWIAAGLALAAPFVSGPTLPASPSPSPTALPPSPPPVHPAGPGAAPDC